MAALSDVHGNLIALEAVLADIEDRGGVDRIWALGDLVALGPQPIATIERLRGLPDIEFSRGNTDRYVVTGDLPEPGVEAAEHNPTLVQRIVETAASFAWTRGMLGAVSQLAWLAALPLELSETLPDGTRLLGVHASPGRDDGDGVQRNQSDTELDGLVEGIDPDLILTGHTHRYVDRRHNGTRFVNLGSVSLPPPDEECASYVLIDAGADGHTITRRLVDYDHEAVRDEIRRADPPGRDFLLGFFKSHSPNASTGGAVD